MVTYDELVNVLKMGAADAARLLVAIDGAETHEDVDATLELANDVLGKGRAFGTEALPVEGAHVDGYYREFIALYVNVGDPYRATLCYDTDAGDFFVGGWGSFLEEWETENVQPEDEDDDAPEARDYCECGEEMDSDCMGRARCPICDDPCPHCHDGGGPSGADDKCDVG